MNMGQSSLSGWWRRAAICAALLLHAGVLFAQTCSVADLNLSGVVNSYWAGTGTLASGSTSVTLGTQRTGTDSITGLTANTTAFAVNDMMLIIQMQDADINTTNTDSYGDGVAGGASAGYSNVRNTGLFHFARVTSVGGSIGFTPATTTEFRSAAAVSGASGQRAYQIIRVPFSRNVTLTGTVRPMSWNGSTGGVVAIEAGQNLVLNAGVNASGQGFRGGGGHGAGGQPSNVDCCPGNDGGAALPATSYTGALPNGATTGGRAAKGEGIAGTPRLVDRRESNTLLYGYTTTDNTNQGYPFNGAFGDFGRGAPGNAGGGGNRHDSGGGGGGNGGPGGKGGGAYDDGSDFGGYGGTAITGFTGDRVFLGGGGGSGQGWHTPPVAGSIPVLSGGGRGGGIVMLRGDVVSGAATLDVRGQSGFGMPTNLGGCNLPLDDTDLRGLGGEGAGAGGSAFLIATSSGLGSVSVDASGGAGGNAGHCDTNFAGPGGGGGGGRVVFFSPSTPPSSNVNGGPPGVIAFTNAAPGTLPGTGQAGSGNGGTGTTLASAPASPCAAPDLIVAKTIASNVTPGQTGATYSIVVTNDGSGPKSAGSTVTVNDTLPAGFTATAISGTGWSCNLGTLTCTRTDALAAGSSYPAITLTFNAAASVPGNTAGTLTNTANVTLTGATESNTGNNSGTRVTPITSVYKSVRVTADPDSSGLANPTVGDTLTWSVFVSNPVGAFAVANFQVTDVLPAGVTITGAGAQTIAQTAGACGALPTLNAAYNGAGTNTLLAAGQTLPANCTVRIDIPTTIATTGTKSNQPTISGTGLATASSDAIDLTTPGSSLPTGVAALANSLTQVQVAGTRDPTLVTPSYPAPTLTKSFNPAGLTPGNSSVMTVTITNTGAVPLTSAGFTDTYPAGLVNATSPNGTSSCGGTVTAVAGGGSLSLSGGTVPASGVCTITVNVTITGNGTYVNTIPAGNLSTGVGVTNAAPATATLYTNPTIAKSFSPGAVAPNADSTLTLVLTNPNTTALTISNPGLTDPFPANLVATGGTVNYSGAGCTGFAPASIAANATSYVLTGGTIPAGSNCSISFAVRSAVAGTYNNTTTGLATVTTGTTGPVSNTASLSVGLISITKFFGPNQIQSGGTSTITYTLTNPTATLQTAGTFLDTMVNMSIAAPGGAAGGTCVGASGNSFVTGATSLNFTGLQIPASGSCTVTVVVTSSVVGTLPNAANGVSTALLTQGPGSNTDNLIVIGKPTVAKAFAPTGIVPTGTSTMTLTLTNPNTIALTGVNFTDSYPANLVNATPLTVGGTCSGVTTTATAGGNSFNVTAATLPASASCTITVLVTSAVAGVYNNSTSGVASTQSGTAGTASNVATLTVSSPATITKAFGTSPISQGGTSVITFTLSNPNASVMNNLNFTDSLVNMTVSSATIGGTCAGVTNAPALVVGATTLNLTVPTLAASSNCTITVTVTSGVSGTHPNTTSGVTSTQTPVAGPASNTANLVVLSPPTLTKSFSPTQIQTGGTSTITFTLSNPNASTALTNITFSDPLFNMTVANATAGGTCAGETFSPVLSVGGTQINPTLPTLAGGASCTITVQVTSGSISIASGHANNTGTVTSTQTPSGSPGASASLVVLAPPVVTKNFLPNYIGTGQVSTLQFTVTNPNPVALTGVSFFDGFPTTPANMTVATPLTTTNSCGGTLDENDAADGDNTLEVNDRSIRLTGGSLSAGGSCTVSINVTAGTAGDYTNNITLVSSTQTPTAVAGGSDFLTVGQMQIQKQFCTNLPPATPAGATCDEVTDIAVNTPFYMWITIFNPGVGNNQNNIFFNDTFPAGMVTVAGAPFVSRDPATVCDAVGMTEAGGNTSFNFNAARHLDDVDNNDTCIVAVSVQGTAGGLKNNTVTGTNAGGGNGSLNGSSDSASVRIWERPAVAKSFTPASIGVGGLSTLRVTLSSPAANPGPMTGVAVTDVFPVAPGAMTLASLTTTNTCGGSLTDSGGGALNVGDVGVRLSGGTIPVGGNCYFEVQVTVPVAGVYNNDIAIGAVTSTFAGSNVASASAALTVTGPSLTKAFSPTTIQRGTNSRLTFTVTNAAGNPAQPSLAFTDSLPANLLVASPANASTTCTGGSVSAVSGSGTITLSGASMNSGTATCEVGVDVTSSITGSYLNNSANISGTSTGLNTAGVNATLTVQNNATLTKAFLPTSIGANGTSVLTFTITNGAGAQGYAGQGFTDSLPAGLIVAATPGVSNSCGGTVTATAGSGTISLANGSISAAPATCTISVNVTSASLGNYVNNSSNISGLTGGLTAAGVNATLQVVGTALTKAFSPTEIGRGGVSTLTFTITNGAGNPTQTGLGFIENLPANVFVAGAPAVTNTCGGTVTATAGAGTITLAGGTITSPAASCTFSVNVTSAFVGSYFNGPSRIVNPTSTMDVSGVNATLNVLENPTVSKSFTPSSMPLNGTSALTITVTNANAVPMTGLQVTDIFPTSPAQMSLANLTTNNTCGGTLTDSGGGALNIGDVGVRVTTGTVPANSSCTITVNVTAATAGAYTNTIAIGGVQTTNAGVNGTAASAILNVLAPPTVTKSYAPNPVVAGGTTVLTITITNPNSFASMTGVAFTDTNPVGVLNTATPAGNSSCGGTVTAAASGTSVALGGAGGTIPASGNCTITVNQSAATAGAYANTIAIGDVTTTNAGSNTAAANTTLNVYTPPTISKAFGANIGPGGTTTLTFTLTNPAANPGAITGVGFTDLFPTSPAAMTLASITTSTTCTGATIQDGGGGALNVGDSGIQVSGVGPLAAGASCTVQVTITAPSAGSYNNTSGAISATSPLTLTGGTAAATLTVVQPALTKAFTGPLTVGGTTTLVFTLTNGSGNPAQSSLNFVDTLRSGLAVAGTPNVQSNCPAGGALVGSPAFVTTGANTITVTGAAMNAGVASCEIRVNLTTSATPTVGTCPQANNTNATADISSVNRLTNSVGTQCVNVTAAVPAVDKAFSGAVTVGGTTTLTFTVSQPTGNPTQTFSFTDTLPAGLLVGTGAVGGTCSGGTVTATAGTNTITVASRQIVNPATTCTITVPVTTTTTPTVATCPQAANTNANANLSALTNITANIQNSAAGGGTSGGGACVTVNPATPELNKVFSGGLTVGATVTLTFTITQPAVNPTQTFSFVDTLPPGLVVGAGALGGTCTGGSVTASAGSSTITVANRQIVNPATSCTITVPVTTSNTPTVATCPNSNNTNGNADISGRVNLTSNIALSAAGGGTSSGGACTTVTAAVPVLTKAFSPTSIGSGETSTLTFTVTQPTGNPTQTFSFTDTLPAGLFVGAGAVGGTCSGGSVTATAGTSTITVTNRQIVNPATSCTITVPVTLSATPVSTACPVAGNTNGNASISGITNLTNNVSDQCLAVVLPSLTKAYGASAIDDSVPTSLVFTLTNGSGNPPQSGLGWTETLPANIRFTAASLPVAYSAGCSGAATVTATGGPPLNQIVLSGITMTAGTASCTVTIGVNGTSGVTNVANQFNASCAGNPAAFTNTSSNITGATRVTSSVTPQCLVVNARPTLTKSFGANPQTIGVGQTATLTFTINNTAASSIARSGLGFTDTLPGAGGITAAAATPQCGGGTVSVTGGNVIAVSGASVAAGASCTITATVTGVTAGSYVNGPTNSSITGVSSNLNNGVTDQTLHVRQATLTKAFGASAIDDAVPTALVFTLTNGAGNPAQSGLGWTETLPANIRFTAASLPVAYSAGCSGGATVTATGGPPLNQIVLSGIAMSGGTASCTVTVGVNGTSGVTNVANQFNASCAGNPAAFTNTSTNITGETRVTDSATAQCLVVNSLPTVTKAFGATNIGIGQTTTLAFSIANTGGAAINRTGMSFSDALPAGLVVANPPVATTSAGCAAATLNGTADASTTFGATAVSVNAGQTCTVTVTVRGATLGTKTNTTGNVTTTGMNNGVTAQTVTVVQPTLTKAFGSASIDENAATALVFTLTNGTGNPAQSGLGWTETLPANIRFTAASLPVAYSAGCSGAATVTATGGPPLNQIVLSNIAMTGGTASCTVTVGVNGSSGVSNVSGQFNASCAGNPAAFTNTSANITGETRVTDGATAQCLVVNALPTITKAFGAANIGIGQTTTLAFSIANTGASTINRTGLTFSDALPAGLVVANPPVATTGAGCAAATLNGTADASTSFGATAVSVNAGQTCVITVTVRGATLGTKTNTTGNVTTTGMNNGVTAQVVTVVQPDVAKTFGAASFADGGTTTLVFTLTNGTGNPAQAGIALGDTLPSGLRFNSATPAVAYSAGCTGPAAAAYTAGTRVLSGLTGIAVTNGTASCTVTVSGLTNEAGQNGTCPNAAQTNLAANVTTTNATNTSTDQCVSVNRINPNVAKTFGAASINDGATTTLVFTLTNQGTNPAQSGIALGDTLPTGLRFNSTTPSVSYSAGCSGPATASYNTGTRVLSGLTGIAMSNGTASCTVTVAGLTNQTGQVGTCAVPAQTNLAANVTTTNATNISTDQCLSVATVPPTVAKTFGAGSFNDGSSTTMVFTLTNQGTNPAQSGIALGDTLPAGLRFSSTSPAVAYGAGCSGPATASYNTGTRVLSGLTGLAMSNGTTTCTVTVSGLTNEAGQVGTCPQAAFTNLAANVTTTNATSSSTDQCVSVNRINPNVAKTFGAGSIADGGTTTLVFTLTNQGTNPAQSGIALGDTLPSGLRFNTATPSVTYSAGCSGPATASYNTGTRVLSGLTGLAMSNGTTTCTVTVAGLTNEPGQTGTCPQVAQTNLAANVTATNATNTSTNQCVSVTAVPPNVAKTFGAASINDGVATTLVFTLTNQGTNPAQSGIALGDTLPSGLRFNTATPSVTYSAGCSGPATASYNTGTRVLSGLTGLAMSNGTTTCTVTVAGLTNEPGQTGTCPQVAQTNLAANVTATNATNTSTNQCLSVISVDLTITKSHVGNFTVGVNGTYTITVSNAAGAPTSSGTITVVDTLPTGLTFVSATGTGWACSPSGQVVTCTTSNTIAGGASAAAITLTVGVTATAQPSVINNVTVSGGSEPAANSGNNFANDNTLVSVAAINQLLTDGAQTTLPGTTVFYPHTFLAGLAGNVVFSTTNVTSPNNPAWTNVIYRDTDCNGTLNGSEGASVLTGAVAVNPGDQVCIIVRDSVPGSAPFNAQNQITVTATFNGLTTYTRTDITSVGAAGSAGLTLAKTVRNVTQGGAVGTSNQARPGDTLEYIITYTNNSSGPITLIVINDSTPAFTRHVSASCGALPPNLLPPCNITQPAVNGTGAYQWSIPNGNLAPGQSGTVTFTVTVQP